MAYQGTEGAYGHQAACQHFGVASRPVALKAYPTFRQMLEAVLEGHADRGVLPIENTTAGSVNEAYDLLLRLNLSLVGEEIVDVRHCLLGCGRADRVAAAHPLASAGVVTVQRVPVDAARLRGGGRREYRAGRQARARNEDPTDAAIASEEAGVHFGLHVLSGTSPTSR